MRTIHGYSRPLLALSLLAAASCSDAGSDPNTPGGRGELFESDLPGNEGGPGRDGNASADADESSKPASAGTDKSANSAERAIVEADIIQVQGDRLYALSRVAGLTVIDLTDKANLKVLGRFRELPGTPFEMYLRDGVILAIYSSWGQYVKTATGYSFVSTSKVVALDVHDPAAITNIGSFDVAGEVSDSRIVGDVMYVVGYQNGYCWNCGENKPQTSILSLDVADVRQVRKIDELFFADGQNQYGWGRRSVTVSQNRMYVAGPEYGQNAPTGSTIQVVDISDPRGDLVEGAAVAAQGQISSRWQMDEHEGVLRVISQTPRWFAQSQNAPLVQTFKVESSQSLSKLGETPLVIPPNEMLNSVRFDGVRGYAITSERTDPLFTIDLSNPAAPRQMGELEMPGWIYHMEPRGNRLVGLGYDQGNKEGALTVSLFDVTDLAQPRLLDRVNFGGSWGHLPEDQDRIHKAFRVLDEQGLILVPYSGHEGWDHGKPCYAPYRSGVQLVDFAADDLTLRGSAPARGEARRALLAGSSLLTVSDEALDSYDISDRASPKPIGRLSIARNVSHALPLANQTVARINQDWYGQPSSTLDIVKLEDVDRPEQSLSELNLSTLLAGDTTCAPYTGIENAYVQGNQINVTYQRYEYEQERSKGSQVRGLLTVDASQPSQPVVLSKLETRTSYEHHDNWQPFYDYYQYGYGTAQTNSVRTTTALVQLEQRYLQTTDDQPRYETRLRVTDLTDPASPTESLLVLPMGDRYSGLVLDGDNVMLSHYERSEKGRARFYVDRVDLGVRGAPKLAGKVNVPGSLLHYDRVHNRLITSELKRTVAEKVTQKACHERFAYADFRYPDNHVWTTDNQETATGTCTGYQQSLHLVQLRDGGAVREDTYALAENEIVSSSSMGETRVAATLGHSFGGRYYGGTADSDCFRCGYGYGFGITDKPAELLTLGGFESGSFTVGRLSVSTQSDPWWGFWGTPPVHVFGTRALVLSQSDSIVVDLSNVAAPTLLRKQPLYGYPQSQHAIGNMVLLALGQLGVQRVDL